MEENVIITGGYKVNTKVTVYNIKGFVADWPSLNTGRDEHGCSFFVNTDNKVVRQHYKVYQIRDDPAISHGQVYLVAGGRIKYPSTYTDSTELLVHGASAWTQAAPLPNAMRGLQGVSLNNQIIFTGELFY